MNADTIVLPMIRAHFQVLQSRCNPAGQNAGPHFRLHPTGDHRQMREKQRAVLPSPRQQHEH
jgi:hypothetical protein